MSAGDWKELFFAAQYGDLSLAKHHLEEGVNPNYQHPEILSTPLIVSIENEQIGITKLLLAYGADAKLKAGFSSDSPMRIAKKFNNKAAIKCLKPYYPSLWKRLWKNKNPIPNFQ